MPTIVWLTLMAVCYWLGRHDSRTVRLGEKMDRAGTKMGYRFGRFIFNRPKLIPKFLVRRASRKVYAEMRAEDPTLPVLTPALENQFVEYLRNPSPEDLAATNQWIEEKIHG